jgi:hypothetical protein
LKVAKGALHLDQSEHSRSWRHALLGRWCTDSKRRKQCYRRPERGQCRAIRRAIQRAAESRWRRGGTTSATANHSPGYRGPDRSAGRWSRRS